MRCRPDVSPAVPVASRAVTTPRRPPRSKAAPPSRGLLTGPSTRSARHSDEPRLVDCPFVDTTLQDPLDGHVLDGRYRIESRIAVGGMATVYRAGDPRLDRVLALKVMHLSLATDGEFVERFIREAKAAARLDHT